MVRSRLVESYKWLLIATLALELLFVRWSQLSAELWGFLAVSVGISIICILFVLRRAWVAGLLGSIWLSLGIPDFVEDARKSAPQWLLVGLAVLTTVVGLAWSLETRRQRREHKSVAQQ